MNNKLRTQDIEQLLFFDIETVSRNKELDVDGEEYDLFAWKNRDKDTDRLKINTELELIYTTKAALSPVYNRVVCISVAFVKDNIVYYKAITGDEKDIIEEFYKILNKNNWIPCGYNIIGFDMPVIRLKAYQSGVETILKDSLSDSMKKPWDMTKNFIDLMEVFKGTLFLNLSLEEVCYLSNIESPKSAIKGHEVTRTYYKKEDGIDIIAKYCNRDTIACVMIFAKLQGIDLSTLQYVDRAETAVEEPKDQRSVLHKLYESNEITDDIRDELNVILSKKKPTAKDRVNLKKILTAHYLTKGDKVAIKKSKEKEINDYLKILWQK